MSLEIQIVYAKHTIKHDLTWSQLYNIIIEYKGLDKQVPFFFFFLSKHFERFVEISSVQGRKRYDVCGAGRHFSNIGKGTTHNIYKILARIGGVAWLLTCDIILDT